MNDALKGKLLAKNPEKSGHNIFYQNVDVIFLYMF